MTVLSAVQAAATVIGMEVPDQLYSATTREMVEMQRLANRVAKQVARDAQWSKLKAIATLTGDGTAEEFDLPADYDRMTKDARLWSSAVTTAPLVHVQSLEKWLAMTVQDFSILFGAWIMYGGSVHILPARASGETIKFPYMVNTIVRANDGTRKAEFNADNDGFMLNETLLEHGIVWNWKAEKGLDYQEDLAHYQIVLAEEIGADRGPSTIAVGRSRWDYDVSTAYPRALG